MDSAWEEAWSVATSTDGWKEAKRSGGEGEGEGEGVDAAVVVTKRNKSGKKIFRATATVGVAQSALVRRLEDTEDLCTWNTTLTQHKILKVGRK